MSNTGNQYKLECSLHGHESDVRAVLPLSNDVVISAARDKTVRSWNRNKPNDFQEDRLYSGHTNYVNALAYLPPNEDHPNGLIVSSGAGKVIHVHDVDRPDEPVYTLIGHEKTVCSLAVTSSGDIISGSWDHTAIVWKNFQQAYVLRGHEEAVWSVLPVKEDVILTASADKTIKLWTNGKESRTFTGHTGVVRDLALLPGQGFVSCSADCTIRVWSFSGQTLLELVGHTNFVYSVAVLSTLEIISSGEDGTIRLWRDGECVQTIQQPCLSVWCINALPNDDIVVGSSDGVVRLFTKTTDRCADQETLKQFDDLVASHAIPSGQIGDIKKDDLPGEEALQVPGKKEGQVIMIRNGNIVEAHQWSTAAYEWQKVGEVVDAVGSDKKQTYKGKEYDYVFDIDISGDDQPGSMLKLPYNVTDNPYDTAQKFIWEHELSQGFLDQIANFIIQNAKGVELGMNNTEYVDPYTGASRYTPGNRAASTSTSYSDPFTGASAYNSTPTPKPVAAKILPQRSPLLFKQASLAALRQKLITTNGQLDPETALSPEQFEHVLSGVQFLQNPTASANGQEQRSAIEAIAKMVTTWPVDLRFPGLDLLRLYALYQPALIIACLADSDLEAFFRVWANLNDLSTVTAPVNKTLETNYMLAVRTYVNLFGSDAGLEYIKSHQLSIYSLLLADGAWQSFKTKNFRLAVYRAVVAIGTLVTQSSTSREAAVAFDARVVLQAVGHQQKGQQISQALGELDVLFRKMSLQKQ
ncbi:hypothetical protein K450DRAFT_233707 [Umbelopsis ramanniana AG]|uniref:Phospholipase A-2-activating protein n=1 Tax=Umbelopsis ramanniana AG TaxID=1314678 RepID=A0AAD5HGL9_UMBRA|nr:uncharacterized protein K450DRAFT_233707 [Umbelopsis ramanniana AG]KAI8581223.1 hypothetical protein K450DRAFT_233707 [Umbelopsis ramanniana AG]